MSNAYVTAPMAATMHAMRRAGAKYSEIMRIFSVSYSTAVYHSNKVQAAKHRKKWRERNKAILADPIRRQQYNEYQRLKRRKYDSEERERRNGI